MINSEDVTDVGLGTWVLGESMWSGDTRPEEAIEAAVDGGVNLIDTAPVYGGGQSERVVGEALESLGIRDDIFLATKCGLEWDGEGGVWRNCRPDRLRQEIEMSLDRLGVETIDLYQVHWPDESVPFDETIELLEGFRDQGLIRYIGVSNFSVQQLEIARQGGTVDWHQPPFNLFEREAEEELFPYCREHGIQTLVYGALCRGLLTGKYEDSSDIDLDEDDIRSSDPKFTDRAEDYIEAVDSIRDFLTNRGYEESLAPLMIRWTATHPGVTTALVGARNGRQARDNARALDVELTEEDFAEIRQIADEVIREPVGPEFMAPPAQEPS